MVVSDEELRAVTSLPGEKRYAYFIKRVADTERAWGLWSEGWALAETAEGQRAFPLWPAREYAQQCAVGDWSGYEAEEIDLESLKAELIPKLLESSTLPGVFPTPDEQGVTPSHGQLVDDIAEEEERY